MESEAFVAWASDDARTKEQRLIIETLVESGVHLWNAQRRIYRPVSLEETVARSREKELNPAYEPAFNEEDLRKAAESLGQWKDWWPRGPGITNLDLVRFFPSFEWVWIPGFGGTDISPLADLPALRKLHLGTLDSDYGCGPCEDYTPLGRCSSLRELTLGFGATWPDFNGLEKLTDLELFEISGNLSALPAGLTLPSVRRAQMYCRPMFAQSVAHFPQLPACEFLTLSGVERLDGIEKMPHLRNLTILGHCRSFEPLAVLTELTCLTIQPQQPGDAEKLPRDISPIARIPGLRFFQIGPRYDIYPDMPRDYAPMAEAPALREIVVKHCPPVQMEVAAIQAGLSPWDDVFLADQPRPLGTLEMILAPLDQTPMRLEPQLDVSDRGLVDTGLRECESRWVADYTQRFIAQRLDHPDWGEVKADATHRTLKLSVQSYDIVERMPEIVAAARAVLARLRPDYLATFGVHLRIKPPTLTPAQQAVEDKLQAERNEWENEARERDRALYRERLHELELKKQQGLEIDPEDFSPPPHSEEDYPQRKPIAPDGSEIRDEDDEEDEIDFANAEYDDDEEGGGEVAIATDPDRPHNPWEEHDHPLYDNYLCAGTILLDEIWFFSHFRGIACHLMQREPDREIPEEKKQNA